MQTELCWPILTIFFPSFHWTQTERQLKNIRIFCSTLPTSETTCLRSLVHAQPCVCTSQASVDSQHWSCEWSVPSAHPVWASHWHISCVWPPLCQRHWKEIKAPEVKPRSPDTVPPQPLQLCPLALPHRGQEPPQTLLLSVTFHTQHRALARWDLRAPRSRCPGLGNGPQIPSEPGNPVGDPVPKAAPFIFYLKTSAICETGVFSVVLGEQCEFLGRGEMQQMYLKTFLIFWIQ